MVCLCHGWRINITVLGVSSKHTVDSDTFNCCIVFYLCYFAHVVHSDMVFIKSMVLVTNSTSFFPSAQMKKLPNMFLMVLRKAREDYFFFSFYNAIELYP